MNMRHAYVILVLVVFAGVVYLILNPEAMQKTWFGEKQQAEKEPPASGVKVDVKINRDREFDHIYIDTHSVSFTRQIDGKFIVYGSGGMYYAIVPPDVYASINKQLNITSTQRWGTVRFKSKYWVRNYPEAVIIEDVR